MNLYPEIKERFSLDGYDRIAISLVYKNCVHNMRYSKNLNYQYHYTSKGKLDGTASTKDQIVYIEIPLLLRGLQTIDEENVNLYIVYSLFHFSYKYKPKMLIYKRMLPKLGIRKLCCFKGY